MNSDNYSLRCDIIGTLAGEKQDERHVLTNVFSPCFIPRGVLNSTVDKLTHLLQWLHDGLMNAVDVSGRDEIFS